MRERCYANGKHENIRVSGVLRSIYLISMHKTTVAFTKQTLYRERGVHRAHLGILLRKLARIVIIACIFKCVWSDCPHLQYNLVFS